MRYYFFDSYDNYCSFYSFEECCEAAASEEHIIKIRDTNGGEYHIK